MFIEKSKVLSYIELRDELINPKLNLNQEDVLIALNIMESNNDNYAEFGSNGCFLFTRSTEEIKQ